MRLNKIIISGLLLLTSISASAECGNLGLDLPPLFGRISIGEIKTKSDYLAEPARGVTIGYTEVYQSDYCFMVQGGVDVNYQASHSRQRIANRRVKCHDRFLTANIPVNIGLHLGDHGASIDPYAGFNMRLNAVASQRADGFGKIDYIDDRKARHFQPGFNVGVDINLFILHLGYRYTKDLVDFIPDKSSRNTTHKITLGMNIP